MSAPLSTEARRFIRLARLEIGKSRHRAIQTIAPGAHTVREACDRLMDRLDRHGPTRAAREARLLGNALFAIPGVGAVQMIMKGPRARVLAVIPEMVGHPLSLADEPTTICLEGMSVEVDKKDTVVTGRVVHGCITEHALGRLAERWPHAEPVGIPYVMTCASIAAIHLDIVSEEERGIVLRLTKGNNHNTPFLVGTLRAGAQRSTSPQGRFENLRRVFFYADWRTVLRRRQLSSEQLEFGNRLAEACVHGKPDRELPMLPPQLDYITGRYHHG